MKKSKIIYEIIAFLLTAALTVTGLLHIGNALLPKHYDFGSVWDTYQNEEENSLDVLFFGSSLCYCDIVPAQIYLDSGIRSFVNGGSYQTLAVTRQYLDESLKTQTPSVVLLELTGAFYDRYTDYSILNVIYMPSGLPRLRAAFACEEQARLAAVFPLYESHERIFQPAEERQEDPQTEQEHAFFASMRAGYTFRDERNPQTVSERSFTAVPGTETYENNLASIRSIAACCEKNGIELVMYFAPCMERVPQDLRQQLFADLLDVPCAAIEDWTELGEQLGIDNSTDWYDSLHMNAYGAAKFSAFLADYLVQLGVCPLSAEPSKLWEDRAVWWQQNSELYHFLPQQ